VDESQSFGYELFDTSTRVENELNPALSAFISKIVLERIAYDTFASKRSTDESVQERCL